MSKTKAMLFGSSRKVKNKTMDIDIDIDGESIEQVSTFKYLGAFLDANLSWSDHIDYMCGKISIKAS